MTFDDEIDYLEPGQEPDGDAGAEQGQLYEHFRVEVDRGQAPVRVDKFLFEKLQHSSRSQHTESCRRGLRPRWRAPVKSSYKVRPGEVVTLMLDRPHYDTIIEPEDIPLDVVYEDDDLMVINKPAGLVLAPRVRQFQRHARQCRGLASARARLIRPQRPAGWGLVHRIDKDTSGLLVVAKTPGQRHRSGHSSTTRPPTGATTPSCGATSPPTQAP